MASALDKIMAQNAQNTASFMEAVSATAQQNADATASQKEALRAAEAASVEMASLEADAAKRKQASRMDIASQLQVTADSENRVRLAKEIAVAQEGMLQANKELATITESSFTDNPLGWMVDQFRKPYVQQQAQVAQQRFVAATGAYEKLDSVAQNGMETVDKLNTVDAGAKFAAQMKQAAADTSFKSAQLDHEAARDGLAAARDLYQVGKDNNAQAWQTLQYETQQRNHTESMAMQKDHFEAAQADKKQEESYYNLLRAGYVALSPPEQRDAIMAIPAKDLKLMLTDNPTVRSAAYNAGVEVVKNGGKFPKRITYDAQSPATAINVAEQMGGLPKSMKWVNDMKQEWAAQGPTGMASRGLRPDGQLILEMVTDGSGKKVATSQAFDQGVNTWLAEKARNIKAKDGSNPFQAPALSVILTNNPDLANLPTVQKLRALGVAGEDLRDATVILKLLSDGGADINKTAEDVSKIYGNARAVTNELNNLQGIGVSPAVLNAGYRQDGVDYTKPAEVAKVLLQMKLSSQDLAQARKIEAGKQDVFNAMWGTK